MSEQHPDDTAVFSDRSKGREESIARFEEAWRRGDHPSIDEYLAQQGEGRQTLLVELVHVELELRLKAGDPARVEEYLERFPELTEDSAVLLALICAEHKIRRRAEPGLRAEEYLRRFPKYQEALTSRLAAKSTDRGDPEQPDTCESPLPAENKHVATSTPDRQTPEYSPGKTIGRYRITRELGRGSFGVVLLTEDEALGRRVAIKVPRPGRFASPEKRAEFLAEARHAAGLKHPCIVAIHDVGEDDDGTPFVVMDYVEGRSLQDVLHAKRPSHAQAAQWIAEVAEAVACAHRHGLVHRDLKPGNILLDADGKPHVVDFGLALDEESQRTRAGECAGTLPYMAPEQVRGDSHRLDGRADIWALGVVLYELLTGRRPFGGETWEQLSEEILDRDPKPPRQIDETIPPELERICLKCLAKSPTGRYTTAADLARDLRRATRPRTARAVFLWPVIGVIVLATLATAWLVGHRTPPAPVAATPHFQSPLEGTADVLVWSLADNKRRGLTLRQPSALPLRNGDQVRVQAGLSRPVYVYLVWIDSQGKSFPVYPWVSGRWDQRPAREEPVRQLTLPEQLNRGWEMGGEPGIETLLLLARETPLPPDADLAALLSGLVPQPMRDARALVEFQGGQMVTDQRQRDRGPQFFDPKDIDDPLLANQQRVAERLRPYFELIRAVSFANGGGR